MSYKKKFEAYLDGILDEEKAMEIEEDLERARILSEYLDEELDDKLFEADDVNEEKDVETDTKDNELKDLVQKAINRKLRRYGLAVGSVVLAIVLFILFGLSPIMNNLYYNPAKQLGAYSKDIDLPLAVYTELHSANRWFNYTDITPEGFGKYSMKVGFQFQGVIENFYVNMDKGKFEGYYYDMLKSNLYGNSFTRGAVSFVDFEPEDDYALSELRKLPDTAIVEAYLSFPKDIDLNELKKIEEEYEDLKITYVPVRVTEEGQMTDAHFGFEPYGVGIVFDEDTYDNKKYNLLDLANAGIHGDTPENREIHFKSMLKYMSVEKNFNKAIDNTLDYEGPLKYVEENGVKTYGIVVKMPVKSLLDMRDAGVVENVHVTDVKLSIFSK